MIAVDGRRVARSVHRLHTHRTYDRIGTGYGQTRRADPCLAQLIVDQLRDLAPVINVGAGTGSYEPSDRLVVAVDPSIVMIRQRPEPSAPVVQARAEDLPFADGAFQAGLAVLTVHHWTDPDRGLKELSRVVRERVVILTCDPMSTGFWLTTDYFPGFVEEDRRRLPSLGRVTRFLSDPQVLDVPIPRDCEDGFLGAYWARPEAYLDDDVRGGISSFANCRDLSALGQLADDLASGRWERRYGDLRTRHALDIGYRLVVGRPAAGKESRAPGPDRASVV